VDCSSTGDTCLGENHRRFSRSHRAYGVGFGGVGTRVSNLGVSGDRLILVEVMGENLTWIGGSVRGARDSRDNVGIYLGTSESFDATPHSPTNIAINGVDVSCCQVGLRLHGAMKNCVIADNRFRNVDHAIERETDFKGNVRFESNVNIDNAMEVVS